MLRRLMLAASTGGSPVQSFAFDPTRKSANVTLSSGDSVASTSTGGQHYYAQCTKPKNSGKWQLEFVVGAVTGSVGNIGIGIARRTDGDPSDALTTQATNPGVARGVQYWSRQASPLARYYYRATGATYETLTTSGTLAATGDVLGLAVDFSTEVVSVYRNGVLVYSMSVSDPTWGLNPGSNVFVPTIKIWGGGGNPTTISIPTALTHPVPGFSGWA